jgi:hypothetical protein
VLSNIAGSVEIQLGLALIQQLVWFCCKFLNSDSRHFGRISNEFELFLVDSEPCNLADLVLPVLQRLYERAG